MLTWDTFRAERARRGTPFVVAQRGVPVVEPENTLGSFALALDQGADAIETDLRFTRDDLLRILRAAPGEMTVATYCGDGDEGELRIVARDGWRAADGDLKPSGGGNVVDLPCLEWLATQRERRIWVSDGHVTGVGDRGCRQLRREAEDLCRRAGITRVGSAKDAEKGAASS